MFRAFVLPVLLMGMIGGPMLYSHHQRHLAKHGNAPIASTQTADVAPWQSASYRTNGTFNNTNDWSAQNYSAPRSFPNASPPTGFPPTYNTDTSSNVQSLQAQTITAPVQTSVTPVVSPTLNGFSTNATVQSTPTSFVMSHDQAWAQPGMTPDFAKTETMVFPGDANGPNLSAQPMSFTPTIDLGSLFRFDANKQWITSRWDRVSTCPAVQGLHGMRVALVTGTNSWDLHGSLTYYFDANHRVQRITFRGWTGDASRLLQTLQQHQLRAQPTHWAGLYLSKRSGLLLKHPAVIDKSNPVQQLALILEINNPKGNSPLSNDFQSLLPAAMATQ